MDIHDSYGRIIEEIRKIETKSGNYFDNESGRRDVRIREVEKQKVYVWIRLYLTDEMDLIPGDDFTLEYTFTGESMGLKFVCYGKKNISRDHDNVIVNYDPEDNKKILCLMVDENDIRTRKDIPFIRTLFKTSPYYQYQVVRREELIFVNDRTMSVANYYDCDF